MAQSLPPRRGDADGITRMPTGNVRTGVWLLLLAVAIVAVMLVLVVGPFIGRESSVAASHEKERVAAGHEQRARRSAATSARAAGESERPRLPASDPQRVREEAPDDVAAAGDAAENASDETAGEPSGIELFPPPGTDPIKAGLVVPEDFQLPPGFIRHYQTTDNGKQLPAILMFHPDYQPVDEKGEKVALPADRIVPPEMAPPGLPHQTLDVPDDSVPMIEGPNDRPDAD